MDNKLKIVVVIPCLAETGIWDTIKSLQGNHEYRCLVECIIVVNHSNGESEEKKSVNRELLLQLKSKGSDLDSVQLRFEVIEAFDLPEKKAGVGLARKIGMEEATQKLRRANSFDDGIIVCLDGDCSVSENYLREIELYFENPKINGCSIYFEHPLDRENTHAIIEYELYLRFYTNALRWCGFPFAFQTVGSSMAVTARAFVKQGGMNTRKAGEDFYFLNKIIQLEYFGDLTSATVFPSPRKSDRVPFGTGREMMEWEINQKLLVYSPEIIKQLKIVFSHVDDFRTSKNPIQILENKIDTSMYDYLMELKFDKSVEEIKIHTASPHAFRKRFFSWMNAFQIMKVLNELSNSRFSKTPIHTSARWLWEQISEEPPSTENRELLFQYRSYDKLNAKQI